MRAGGMPRYSRWAPTPSGTTKLALLSFSARMVVSIQVVVVVVRDQHCVQRRQLAEGPAEAVPAPRPDAGKRATHARSRWDR